MELGRRVGARKSDEVGGHKYLHDFFLFVFREGISDKRGQWEDKEESGSIKRKRSGRKELYSD